MWHVNIFVTTLLYSCSSNVKHDAFELRTKTNQTQWKQSWCVHIQCLWLLSFQNVLLSLDYGCLD